jgi:uncharacterized protein YuzE
MDYKLTKHAQPKISYDKESEVLSIELKKGKSVDSDIQNNAVVDYDKENNILRINFYDFDSSSFKHNRKTLDKIADVVLSK